MSLTIQWSVRRAVGRRAARSRDANGNPTSLLLAKPNAGILYATLTKAQIARSTIRSTPRAISCGVIDAGGGFQNYPEDYAVIQKLADGGQMTTRLAYNLFTQKPKQEKEDFLNWTKTSRRRRRLAAS